MDKIFKFGLMFILTVCFLACGKVKDKVENMTQEEIIPRSFESQAWKDDFGGIDKGTVRIQMLDDLLKNYKIKGLSTRELEGLLGKPSSVNIEESPDHDYIMNYDASNMQKSLKGKSQKILNCVVKNDTVISFDVSEYKFKK